MMQSLRTFRNHEPVETAVFRTFSLRVSPRRHIDRRNRPAPQLFPAQLLRLSSLMDEWMVQSAAYFASQPQVGLPAWKDHGSVEGFEWGSGASGLCGRGSFGHDCMAGLDGVRWADWL